MILGNPNHHKGETMLTKEQAERICEELEDLDPEAEAEVVEGYSGRGMYGTTVIAISTHSKNLTTLGFAAASAGVPIADVPRRSDNLGRGWIIY